MRLARPRSPPKQEQSDEPETEVPPPPRMFPSHQDMFPPVPPAAVSALSLTPPHSEYSFEMILLEAFVIITLLF